MRLVSLDIADHKSTLVHVMAWCHVARCHHLGQCCPNSTSPNNVTRPQWVKIILVDKMPLSWSPIPLHAFEWSLSEFCAYHPSPLRTLKVIQLPNFFMTYQKDNDNFFTNYCIYCNFEACISRQTIVLWSCSFSAHTSKFGAVHTLDICQFFLRICKGHFQNACKLLGGISKTLTSLWIWELLNLHFSTIYTSFNVCVRCFVWNFKGYLWNSTQNILRIHWKIWFLCNVEILRVLRFASSYRFLKCPPSS